MSEAKLPTWYWVAAGLGLLWNLFGAVQFLQSVNATAESLIASGLTPEQAQVMTSYPVWMTVAFAIGTFGGLIGSVLLLLKKKMAIQIFTVSLVGYIILYIGDITEGVFKAMGTPQIIILTTVVAIAAALLYQAKSFKNQLT